MSAIVMGNAHANIWLQTHLTNPARWLAWHVDDPGSLGDTATELYGAGYSRQRILFGTPAAKATLNTNNLIFSNLPESIVRYLAIWSLQFGGEMVLRMPVTAMTVHEGYQILVAVGDVAVALP